MTTTDRTPARRPTVIDGQVVPAPTVNPHTTALRITAVGLVATALGSFHGIQHNPDHLQVIVGADSAAIAVFLFNLFRFWKWQP